MRQIILCIMVFGILSCSDNKQKQVEEVISKTSDSLISKLDKANDSLVGVKDKIVSKLPEVSIETFKNVPISLQWISFDKPGNAKLFKMKDGWYQIKGEQINEANEFVKIDGKLQRLDKARIKFVGTIITYVKYNNDGKPCEKTGEQIFLTKDNRKYHRLQNMKNCAGGMLVDYVDLYNLDKLM